MRGLREHNINIKRGTTNFFCTPICFYDSTNLSVNVKCAQCNKQIIKKNYEIQKSKSDNVFCSSSCAAKYNNKHKKFGSRRSKLEHWLEQNLLSHYNMKILFNDKQSINSELDIYIPSLSLAFEINGIFHYKPIYGRKKLKQIQDNDQRKKKLCKRNSIKLKTINASLLTYFTPKNGQKYLNQIVYIINSNM